MKEFNIENSLGFIVAKTNHYMKTYFTKLIKDNGLDITTEQWAILNSVYHNLNSIGGNYHDHII